jgi:catechol 2,3-dioxygenase-like lactoylglutathione lyase family enzyme
MRLNHLDLHVPDVAATAHFFTTYLGLTPVETRANGGLMILSDGHGLELVLSHAIAKFGSTDQTTSQLVSYHVGFIVERRDEVDRVHAAMTADGLEPQAPREMRGGWLFYCYAPGNILVEIGARPLFE